MLKTVNKIEHKKMEEKIIKRCICRRCGYTIDKEPNASCPRRCPSCNDEHGDSWYLPVDKNKYSPYTWKTRYKP
jgi:predicted Zn-ribbon and HTH transcriptional regulator